MAGCLAILKWILGCESDEDYTRANYRKVSDVRQYYRPVATSILDRVPSLRDNITDPDEMNRLINVSRNENLRPTREDVRCNLYKRSEAEKLEVSMSSPSSRQYLSDRPSSLKNPSPVKPPETARVKVPPPRTNSIDPAEIYRSINKSKTENLRPVREDVKGLPFKESEAKRPDVSVSSPVLVQYLSERVRPSSSNLSKDKKCIQVKRGPTYDIPEDYKALISKNIVPQVLKKPLSPLTYKDYFAALLYAEDNYEEIWSDYLLSGVTLELHKAEIYEKGNKNRKLMARDKHADKYFVAFEIDNDYRKRPFLLSRDFVLARPVGKNAKPFKGVLYRVVNRNVVLAEFGDDFLSRHSSKCKYDVSFTFNRVCLKRSHQALKAVADALFTNFLFPNQASRIHFPIPIPYSLPVSPNLSNSQASAIYHISNLKSSPPYLVEGPLSVSHYRELSSTGVVIQKSVFQILKTSPCCRILINAPTNNTCDVLMRSLMEEIPESDMFRANAAFREKEDVPTDIFSLSTFEEGCFTCPSVQELKNFKVILSTPVSSFRLRNEGLSSGHFSHIFLVDACLAIEPETMIALANLAEAKTIVVVSGSSGIYPNQVRSDIARANGLRISYFQRLFKSEPYCTRDPMFIKSIS